MDLAAYRASDREKARIGSLFSLVPQSGKLALDVGARDGYLSRLLSQRFDRVIALDLEMPTVTGPGIEPVAGNVAALQFDDNTFDVVLCAEVLEHIPSHMLERACSELRRVARHAIVIGVPYKQDLRCGRTTCAACGKQNPPWGHVNSFDERRLATLFRGLPPTEFSYVGTNFEHTNFVSSILMDFAGNPYGTYEQEEPCVYCGATIQGPRRRALTQKIATKAAFELNRLQQKVATPRANWIHVRFDKSRDSIDDPT